MKVSGSLLFFASVPILFGHFCSTAAAQSTVTVTSGTIATLGLGIPQSLEIRRA